MQEDGIELNLCLETSYYHRMIAKLIRMHDLLCVLINFFYVKYINYVNKFIRSKLTWNNIQVKLYVTIIDMRDR